MVYYEELIKRYDTNGILKSKEEKLLDDYTSTLVKLNLKDNSAKYFAYKQHLNYCKYKKDLKATIEVSLELMKYADDIEIGEVLYGLLVALFGIEIGSFKNDTLNDLVDQFKLSGEARGMFINLFSYHNFDRAFVEKIQQDIKIIKQAFLEQNPEIHTTITKFLDAFIIQTGKCSVNTIKEIVDDPNFESATPESVLNILSCLKNWSKDKIEQINYQKVLKKLLSNDHLENDLITNIKVAELYLAIEDLVQTKRYLDSAEKLLKAPTLRHTFFQQAAIDPKVYLSEYVKLGFMLKAFEGKNEDFLKANLSYIKKTYENCCTIKEEFSSAYQNVLNICQYHLLSIDSTTNPNLGEKLKNIIHDITEDDELTFALEVINQTIGEEQRIKEQHIGEEQQIVILASEHIEASNYVSKEYSSEEKSETEVNNTATTQETIAQEYFSYKENFVTKCLNHWTIIHKYYQKLKKSTQSSHDKTSGSHQENYQIWHIPDKVSYTTKNEDIVNIGKKHHNIYAVINPDLLGSLQESQQKAFITALNNGLVNKNHHQKGIKKLGKCFLELKIAGGTRLYSNEIFENNDGAILIEFNKKGSHTDVKNALKYTTINVTKVSGADYHTQEEDSTLKCNIPQEDYPNIEDYPNPDDEVSCIGEES
ncbi:MAG: hypothetical protein LN569_03035 [Rickettsia endosymbiont of Labidopullus appendiculatus]|nr:hypothetical protein [Rickettsia endosymbiont of Labidopullus appendiculatus]